MKRLAAAVVLVVGFAVPAVAQTENVVQEPDKVVVRKNTTVIFGDHGIDGTADHPAGITVSSEYKPGFASLVQRRVSFHNELNQSVDNL